MIKINDKYSIRYNHRSKSWVLAKNVMRKNKKTKERYPGEDLSYFGKLEYAFYDIINEVPSEAVTLPEIMDKLDQTKKEILAALKKYHLERQKGMPQIEA